MSDLCSICFDKIDISRSKICIGCNIRNYYGLSVNTTICIECSKNCIETNMHGPSHKFSIFCSYACLYVSVNHADNVRHYIDWYESNKLNEETKLALTNSQMNLIEYWNYEKDKSIIQLLINYYLINDVANMVLEYLQS